MSHQSPGSRISPVMRALSCYMADALKRQIPTEVSERAKIHLVDTFAAMISGSRLVPGRRAVAYVRSLGGRGEAGVVGSRIVTSALHAALANGICVHADETDDVHWPSRSHPGAGVIPAALATAERKRLSGTAMLRAVVLGYDICARTLFALKQAQVRDLGFHPSSKGTLFGATAAAGALLGLDAHRMRYVLSYCAEQAAGLTIVYRDSEHNEKAYLCGGMPAHNGVAAAQMVASGFTGVEDVLAGDGNFLSAFSRDADPRALVRGLGRDFEILRGAIKYWPVGAPIQASLHVLHDLIRQHRFKADDVEKLVARVPHKDLNIVDNRDMPDICLQHLVAVMLIDGALTFRTAHDFRRMRDPRVLKLRRKHIQVIADPALTDPKRLHWRSALEITLKNGRKLVQKTMAAKGGLGNPLTRAEVAVKALDLMAPILGKRRSEALMSQLFNIERLKDVRALRRLYAA